MRTIGFILILGFLVSCEKKVTFIKNENLIKFQSKTVMDMNQLIESGEGNYQKLISENLI